MAKFFKLLILLPIAVVVIAFAIANRQLVSISFDPFSDPSASSAFVTAPLFIVLFLTLIVGLVVGGVSTWFTQGSNRRKVRVARDEAEQWRGEVRRMRDQPPLVTPVVTPAGRAIARRDYA